MAKHARLGRLLGETLGIPDIGELVAGYIYDEKCDCYNHGGHLILHWREECPAGMPGECMECGAADIPRIGMHDLECRYYERLPCETPERCFAYERHSCSNGEICHKSVSYHPCAIDEPYVRRHWKMLKFEPDYLMGGGAPNLYSNLPRTHLGYRLWWRLWLVYDNIRHRAHVRTRRIWRWICALIHG